MGIDAQSTGHTKAQAETLERAARKLLGLPRFPDGANGPRGKVILAQINADRAKLGDVAAARKWAAYCGTCHAHVVDSDPAEIKAMPSARPLVPAKDGTFSYPDSPVLRAALATPAKRAKCSVAELAVLNAHAANAKPVVAETATLPKEGRTP